jgi:hypothetical protein
MDDDELLAAFRAGVLDRFPHEDHLRVMRMLVGSLPFDDAVDQMRAGIQRMDPVKYHETRTVAWARLVAAGHPGLERRDLLDDFYSPEVLDGGRAIFVEPDRRPLP